MRPVKKTVEELKSEIEKLEKTFERRKIFLRTRQEKEYDKLISSHHKNLGLVKARLLRLSKEND